MARRHRLLAVASGGGHWTQLRRLTEAFADHEVVWASTRDGYRDEVPGQRYHAVRDANLTTKLGLILLALQMLWLVVRVRPTAVISTGAAPGYFAVRFAKWFGARTIWVDSIANVEQLSVSGQRVGRYADLWLTQWPHLATGDDAPLYAGGVL